MRLNHWGLVGSLLAVGIAITAGCGGGGDKPDAPCGSSVTGSPFYDGGNNAAMITAGVNLDWTPLCEVRSADIIEYHVLRDGILVGVTKRDKRKFFDGTPAQISVPLIYQSLTQTSLPNEPAAYQLITQTTSVPYFGQTPGPHTYVVKAVIGQKMNNQTVYEERVVGVTEPITTPFF